MSLTLKRYPEYKDSQLPWLGNIPAHWGVDRCKYLLRECNERSVAGTETLLSVSQYTGVTPRRFRNGSDEQDTRSESLAGYKIAATNDLVVNTMLAWNGSLGIAGADGIVSPAYAVYRFNNGNLPRYFHFLLRTQIYRGRFKVASTGVVESRLRLYPEDLLRVEALVPPPDEQHLIAMFVELLNRRVDKLIRAKRQVIELLNEQKQTIIQRAVTRGLDPHVSLKSSGIEWLGAIPRHWGIWQIGHFSKVGNGSTPSRGKPAYWAASGYPWLNSSTVNQDLITSSDQFVTDLALRECHLPRVLPGSVLVAITGQGKTRGTSALLGIEATINQHIAFISPDSSVVAADYLQVQLIAAYSTLRTISSDAGSTKGALTCADIKHFRVVLPSIHEQRQIVDLVQQETKQLDATISQAKSEIELLREYRTRLIADVVTGRLDVRGVELNDVEEVNDLEDEEPGDSDELDAVEESADAD